MELRIPFSDDKALRVLDAFAAKHGYTGFDKDGNPQTKAHFARDTTRQWILTEVRQYEQDEAATVARGQVTDIDG